MMRTFLKRVRWGPVLGAVLIFAVAALSIWWVLTPTPTGTTLERSWTAIALWALVFTCWLLDNSVRDYGALRMAIRRQEAVRYGPRWWISVATMVTAVVMYIVWIGFALIGILSLSVSASSPEWLRIQVGTITVFVLVGVTALLASAQAAQVYFRRKIDHGPPYPSFRPDTSPFMRSHPNE